MKNLHRRHVSACLNVSLGTVLAVMAMVLWSGASQAEPRVVKVCMASKHATHWVAREIMAPVYERAGLKAEFVLLPNRRSMLAANEKACDAEVARIHSATKSFPNLAAVPTPVFQIKSHIYGFDDSVKGLKGWDAIKGKVIGYVRGELYAENGLKGHETLAAETYDQLFELLALKRVDVVVGMLEPTTKALGDRRPAHPVYRSREPVFAADMHHLVHVSEPDLNAALETIIAPMVADGTLKGLYDAALARLKVLETMP